MLLKKTLIFMLFFPSIVFADDICSKFKYDVDINLNKIINDDVSIKKSEKNLVGELGYAKLAPGYKYNFYTVTIPVMGGYCISLREVNIDVIYPSFDIVIDKDLKEDGCAYKYVLEHEKDHIRNTRKVLDSNLENVKEKLLTKVANSIDPIFVKDPEESNSTTSKIGEQLQNHPEIVEFLKKIDSEIEQENIKIDTRGDQYEIYKCKDFFEQRKKVDKMISTN